MSEPPAQPSLSKRLSALKPALLSAGIAALLSLSAWLAAAQSSADQPLLPTQLDVEPLVPGAPSEMKASWNEGTTPPLTFFVELTGLEELDGTPHVHRTWTLPGRRNRRAVIQEWLRPTLAEDGQPARLLLGARTINQAHQRIEPPLPLLVAPLAAGQTWTWQGQVGSFRGEAKFRVLAPTRADTGELVVRVEQTTTLASPEGPLESTVVRGYCRGVGQVEEVGRFPLPHKADGVVGWREATPAK